MLGILRRVFSFSDWNQHHPNEPPPGDMLDASFDAQNNRISELDALVSGLLRSDGALHNETVAIDSLKPELLRFFTRNIEETAQNLAQRVLNLAKEAQKARDEALEATNEAKTTIGRAESAKIAVSEAERSILARISAFEARSQEISALTTAPRTDYDDGGAAAQAWADSSRLWAEHMPDTLPDNALKIMDVTGDHWSSRWWANQAANAFGMLTSLYLGVHPAPPITGNTGGPITVGSIYYDSTTGQAYVWTGSQWESFYGVQRAATMSLWYAALAGQTVFLTSTPDLHGNTFVIDPTMPEGVVPHVNGARLMPSGPGSAEGDFDFDAAASRITFLRPLRAGDIVNVDILMPVEALGPGNVNSWRLAPLSPDGVATVFSLACADVSGPLVTVQRNEELLVSVDGVVQEPTVSYSASGATITFVSAPDTDSVVFITWHQSDGGTGAGSGGGASVTIGDTPPVTPAVGDLWWNSSNGELFVRYDDTTSVQWVPASVGTANRITVSTTAPSGPALNDLWMDIT
jgi:hypothetical protein